MHGASSTLLSPTRVGTSSSSASTTTTTTIMAPYQDESALLDHLAKDLTFMKKTEKHKFKKCTHQTHNDAHIQFIGMHT